MLRKKFNLIAISSCIALGAIGSVGLMSCSGEQGNTDASSFKISGVNSLYIGEKTILTVDTDANISWSTDDSTIAKITVKGGVVTAVSEGNVTFTATDSDGNKATFKMAIKARSLSQQLSIKNLPSSEYLTIEKGEKYLFVGLIVELITFNKGVEVSREVTYDYSTNPAIGSVASKVGKQTVSVSSSDSDIAPVTFDVEVIDPLSPIRNIFDPYCAVDDKNPVDQNYTFTYSDNITATNYVNKYTKDAVYYELGGTDSYGVAEKKTGAEDQIGIFKYKNNAGAITANDGFYIDSETGVNAHDLYNYEYSLNIWTSAFDMYSAFTRKSAGEFVTKDTVALSFLVSFFGYDPNDVYLTEGTLKYDEGQVSFIISGTYSDEGKDRFFKAIGVFSDFETTTIPDIENFISTGTVIIPPIDTDLIRAADLMTADGTSYQENIGNYTDKSGTSKPIGTSYFTQKYRYDDYEDGFLTYYKEDTGKTLTRSGYVNIPTKTSHDLASGIYKFEQNSSDGTFTLGEKTDNVEGTTGMPIFNYPSFKIWDNLKLYDKTDIEIEGGVKKEIFASSNSTCSNFVFKNLFGLDSNTQYQYSSSVTATYAPYQYGVSFDMKTNDADCVVTVWCIFTITLSSGGTGLGVMSTDFTNFGVTVAALDTWYATL